MSSKRLKRITNEIKELHDSKSILENSGIYFHYNEEDMTKIYALLLGPEKTPYEKGYYFFKFEYPQNYPMEPPIAKYYTQGSLKNISKTSSFTAIRFNPNLYVDGKVCLSMLNTWSGPGWVPTNTICNVLVAIQALVLNEDPLKNEPGFELAQKNILQKYNRIIEYANIKIAVMGMILNPPHEFDVFKDIMIELFFKNIEYFKNFILTNNEILNNTVIESPAYSLKFLMDYQYLLTEFNNFSDKLKIEKNTKNENDIIGSIDNIKI